MNFFLLTSYDRLEFNFNPSTSIQARYHNASNNVNEPDEINTANVMTTHRNLCLEYVMKPSSGAIFTWRRQMSQKMCPYESTSFVRTDRKNPVRVRCHF